MIFPPHINSPVLIYHDPVTRRAFYNISWNPPKEVVLIDIERYEVSIGSFEQSTSDTYVIVELMVDEDVTVDIRVSVIDRCNRRRSTPIPFILKVPDNMPPGMSIIINNNNIIILYNRIAIQLRLQWQHDLSS